MRRRMPHGMELIARVGASLECHQCGGLTTTVVVFGGERRICLRCLHEAVQAIDLAIESRAAEKS